MYNEIQVTLPAEVMRQYKELEREFLLHIQDEDIAAPTAAALSTKLRQLANGGLYTEDRDVVEVHDCKVVALTELQESLGGASMLVLYQFKHDIARIRTAFKDVPYIGSGVSNNVAEGLCRRFNCGTLEVLLAHPDSVGHGLNLQGHSNHVVFFGLPWSFEQREQAIRRVYRQGNKNTHVFVHDITAKGTIDSEVSKALNRKDANQASFLRALKLYSGE